jgi:hypothetical protein
MRWENQNVPNSSQQFEVAHLTEKVAELEKRIAALEKRLTESSNDNDVIDLSEARFRVSGDGGDDPVESTSITSTCGRRPLIPRHQLARRRDDLINFIEPRWPDLLWHMKDLRAWNIFCSRSRIPRRARRRIGSISTRRRISQIFGRS